MQWYIEGLYFFGVTVFSPIFYSIRLACRLGVTCFSVFFGPSLDTSCVKKKGILLPGVVLMSAINDVCITSSGVSNNRYSYSSDI